MKKFILLVVFMLGALCLKAQPIVDYQLYWDIPPTIASVTAGANVTYQLRYKNNDASQQATSVNVHFTFDALLQNINCLNTANGTSTPMGLTGSIPIGTLNAGDAGNLIITGTLISSAIFGTPYMFNASITANEAILDWSLQSVNLPAALSFINTEADLSVVIRSVNNSPIAGKPNDVSLVVDYYNAGPSDADNVTINAAINPAAVILSLAYTLNGATIPNGSVNLPTLIANDAGTIEITGTLHSNAAGSLLHPVSISSNTSDNNITNNNTTQSVTIKQETDLSIVLDNVSPAPYIAGASGTTQFGFNFENNGYSDITGITITTAGLSQLTGTNFILTTTSGVILTGTWSGTTPLFTLEANERGTLSISGTIPASITSDFNFNAVIGSSNSYTDTDTTNNSANVNLPITKEADLYINTTGSPSGVVAGESITYIVNFGNNGPSNAANVQINFTSDYVFTQVQFNTDGGAVWQNWTSAYSAGILAPGSVGSLYIKCSVASSRTTPFDINFFITSSTNDPGPAVNSAMITTTVATLAKLEMLSVTQTNPIGNITAGTEVTYQLIYINGGPSDALGSYIIESATVALTSKSYSLNSGTTWTSFSGNCPIGIIPADGIQKTLLIKGTIPSSTPKGTQNFSATVMSTTPDDNLGNNIKSAATVSIVTAGNLTVSLSQSHQYPIAGDTEMVYTAVFSNSGPSNANSIVVEGADLQKLTNPQYTVLGAGISGAWIDGTPFNIGSIAAGTSKTVEIRGIVRSGATGNINFTIKIVSSDLDTEDNSDNTDSIIATIVTSADLSISITTNITSPVAGSTSDLIYTVTYHNAGPSDVTNIVLNASALPKLDNKEYTLNGIPSGAWTGGNISGGSLSKGSSGTLIIKGTVLSSAIDTINFIASVYSTTLNTEINSANNVAQRVLTIVTEADLGVVVTMTPSAPVAGETTMNVTVRVSNSGSSNATNVVVSGSTLPKMTSPQYSVRGINQGNWTGANVNIGAIAKGAYADIVITGAIPANETGVISFTSAYVSSDLDTELISSNNTDTKTVTIISKADLEITGVTLIGNVVAGEKPTYKIDYRNNGGPSNATAIQISQISSPALTGIEYSTDGVSFSTLVGSYYSVSLLVPNQTGTVYFRGTLASSQTGTLNFTANITSTAITEVEPTNNSKSATPVTISKVADLSITISQSNSSPVAGSTTMVYTVNYANAGPSDATNVVINGTTLTALSALFQNLRYSLSPGGALDQWGGSLQVGTVTSGGSGTFYIQGDVLPSATGNIVYTVSISSADLNTEVNSANNSATATATVSFSANLYISTNNSTQVIAGEEIIYTINYGNSGPSNSTGVNITFTPPTGTPNPLTSVYYGTDGTNFPQPWTGTLSIGNIAYTGTGVLYIKGLVPSNVTSNFNCNFDIYGSYSDPNTTNNSAPTTTTVSTLADLEITITQAPETNVVTGTFIEYTLSYKNNGPSNSLGTITITDNMASFLTDREFDTGDGLSWRPNWTGSHTINGLIQGASGTIKIKGKVPSSTTAASYTINANITKGATDDQPTNNNSATKQINFIRQADKRIISATQIPSGNITAGTNVTFEIEYENIGPSDESGAIITYTPPALLTSVKYGTDGVTFPNNWTSPSPALSMTVGQIRKIWITGTVSPAAISNLSSTFTVGGAISDLVSGNNSATVVTPIITSADLEITDITQNYNNVIAGQHTLTYTISYKNNGNSDSRGTIKITDNSLDLFGTASYRTNGTWMNWLGTLEIPAGLAAGASGSFEIQGVVPASCQLSSFKNIATIIKDLTDDNTPGNNSKDRTVNIERKVDLRIPTVGQEPSNNMYAGNELIFVITCENYVGPSNEYAATLSYTPPPSLFTGALQFSIDGGFDYNTWTSPYPIGTFLAGDQKTIRIKGTIDPNTSGNFTSSFTLSGLEDDTDNSNNTKSVQTVVTPRADLRITTFTSSQNPENKIIAGQVMTYTIEYDNYGPSNSKGVIEITDNSAALLVNTTYSIDGGALQPNWSGIRTHNGLNAKQTGSIVINGRVPTSAAAQTFTNTARIKEDLTNDPTQGNNISTQTITVSRSSDLKIVSVSKSPTDVYAGMTVTYDIVYENAGPSNNTSVVIEDNATGNLIGLQYRLNNGAWQNGWTGIHNISVLEPGTYYISVSGKIPATATAADSFDYEVEIRGATTDPDLSNNNGFVRTDIGTRADLEIKSISQYPTGSINAGDLVTYTIKYRNNGESNALTATLSDNATSFLSTTGRQYNLNGGGWQTWNGSRNISNLPVDDSAAPDNTIEVRGYIMADRTTNCNYTFSISSLTNDHVPSNNSKTITTYVGTSADLMIVSVGFAPPTTEAIAGDDVILEILYKNEGPSYSKDVKITTDNSSSLFTGTRYYSLDDGNSWRPEPWTVPYDISTNLAPSTTINHKIWIKGSLASNITHNTSRTYTNNIGSPSTSDPDLTNNDGSFSMNVIRVADLEIDTITSNPNIAVAGGIITYTINYRNNGKSNASNLKLVDNALTVFDTNEAIAYSTDNVIWYPWSGISNPLGNLSAGSSGVFYVRGTVPADQTTKFPYEATISSDTEDRYLSNNTFVTNTILDILSEFKIDIVQTPSNHAHAGQEVTYNVKITNEGPSIATGVLVLCEYPSDTLQYLKYFDGTSWLSWIDQNIFSMAVGSDVSYIIKGDIISNATPCQEFSFIMKVKSDNSDGFYTKVHPTDINLLVDLKINTLTADPDIYVNAGDTITYAASVINTGPSVAKNIIISTPSLPIEFETVQYSTDNTSWDDWNGSFTLDQLAIYTNDNKDSLNIWFRCIVKPDIVPNSSIVMTIKTGSNTCSADSNNSNNTATHTVTTTASADLNITKTVNIQNPLVESEVEFTITVSNAGPSDAQNVVVTDNFKTGYSNIIADVNGVGIWDDITETWTIPVVAANETVTLILTATVNPTGIYLNKTSVVSTTTDPNMLDNEDEITPQPIPVTDLKIEMDVNENNPHVDDFVTFTIKLTNNGPSKAINPYVEGYLPESSFEFVSTNPSTDTSWDSNTHKWTWTIANLSKDAFETLEIVAKIKPHGDWKHTVTAFVTEPAQDSDNDNNSVEIGLNKENTAPEANDDNDYEIDEIQTDDDDILDINKDEGLLANDTDIDEDDLVVVRFIIDGIPYDAHETDIYPITIGGKVIGEITIRPNGSIKFIPTKHYFGQFKGLYTISDGVAEAMAEFTITVNNVNSPPFAGDFDIDFFEKDTLKIPFLDFFQYCNDNNDGILGGLDYDSVEIIYGLGQANGFAETILDDDGILKVRYTPEYPNFWGNDEFWYRIWDNGVPSPALCDSAKVTVTVKPVNDKPVMEGRIQITCKEINSTATTEFNIKDLNCEMDPLNPNHSYYCITDHLDTDFGDHSIGINWDRFEIRPPVDLYNGENSGDFKYNNGVLTFTPNLNYWGDAISIFTVYDYGNGLSNESPEFIKDTIFIHVTRMSPLLINDTIRTNRDQFVIIDVLKNDNEGDLSNLHLPSLDVKTKPVHGVAEPLEEENGTRKIKYTPKLDYEGNDMFEYTIMSKGGWPSKAATVFITVDSVPKPPRLRPGIEAVKDTLIMENQHIYFILDELFKDPDDDMVYNSIEYLPLKHGAMNFDDIHKGILTYETYTGDFGDEIIKFTIGDETKRRSEPIQRNITITNESLQLKKCSFTLNEVGKEDHEVMENRIYDIENCIIKPDGVFLNPDSLKIILPPDPIKCEEYSVVENSTKIYYKPNKYEHGSDSLYFRICTQRGYCIDSWLNIDIIHVNNAPEAKNFIVDFKENSSWSVALPVYLNINDVDNPSQEELTVSILQKPKLGKAKAEEKFIYPNWYIYYYPEENINGNDIIEYKVTDPDGLSDSAYIFINITPTILPPKANDDYFGPIYPDGEYLDVIANDYSRDAAFDPASVKILDFPKFGDAIPQPDGKILYIPDNEHYGSDYFIYEVCHVEGVCDFAKVTIFAIEGNEPIDLHTTDWFNHPDWALTYNAFSRVKIGNEKLTSELITLAPSRSGEFKMGSDGTFFYSAYPCAYRTDADGCNIDIIEYEICCDSIGCWENKIFVHIMYLDSDNDGIPDCVERDGIVIKDEDGYVISFEFFDTDTDGDGIPDYLDTDSDNDGIPDKDESGITDPCKNDTPRDSDNDGIPDYRSIPIMRTFSPNNDGVNDFWIVQEIDKYPNNELTIYNRWGNLVYKKKPYDNTWNGKSNVSVMGSDDLPEGTYYYILKYDKNRTAKGSVYLKR